MTTEEVQHGSRSCFSINVYAKLNVFNRFRFSVAHTFHLSVAHSNTSNILPQRTGQSLHSFSPLFDSNKFTSNFDSLNIFT